MKHFKFETDRTIDSTENNEYVEGLRDENLVEENLIDTEIPFSDEIPDIIRETKEDDRPLYDEEGYRKDEHVSK
ncbi:hypothetical protein LJB92_00935 [Bacteroidales bacterium OttesenSCG-928-M06]|nr:hypothetical protein [Bacteroidales bacterium OttesenSCG-928-M06]